MSRCLPASQTTALAASNDFVASSVDGGLARPFRWRDQRAILGSFSTARAAHPWYRAVSSLASSYDVSRMQAGIIDILQKYDDSKKLERLTKIATIVLSPVQVRTIAFCSRLY